MDEAERKTLTLDPETVATIDRRVASGAYDSPDEVVQAGLDALDERDHDLERFIRDEVLPVYDHVKAHPDDVVTMDEVDRGLYALHAKHVNRSS